MHPAGSGEVTSQPSASCSRAIEALRSVRRHFRPDDAKKEQRRNFSPYAIPSSKGKDKGKGKERAPNLGR